MSSFLIKNAKIIQAKSALNNTRKDILIKKGLIVKIDDNISDASAQVIQSDNLHVSIGWLDLGTTSGEPGLEHRENFETLSQSAASGGFTSIAVFPNAKPVTDNKSTVQYIQSSTKELPVEFLPIAAISKNCNGEDITEMIDLSKNGAIAFSDGHNAVQKSGMMLRALQYSKVIDGLIIHHPVDLSISEGNNIHEGAMSTSLGLKASPALSEALVLERDIQLTEYAEARLLAHTISSAQSVQKLRTLKSKNVFASVAYLNLCKTDESLASFNVNYKVSPPLRSEDDRQQLIQAVKDGLIDVICSNHLPLEEEMKKKEFVYAESGAIGLQTLFPALNALSKEISLAKIVQCLSINPRNILNLDVPLIEVDNKANLTLFDPDLEWTLNDKSNRSKSKNSPFWNQQLKGKVLGIINGKKQYFNS